MFIYSWISKKLFEKSKQLQTTAVWVNSIKRVITTPSSSRWRTSMRSLLRRRWWLNQPKSALYYPTPRNYYLKALLCFWTLDRLEKASRGIAPTRSRQIPDNYCQPRSGCNRGQNQQTTVTAANPAPDAAHCEQTRNSNPQRYLLQYAACDLLHLLTTIKPDFDSRTMILTDWYLQSRHQSSLTSGSLHSLQLWNRGFLPDHPPPPIAESSYATWAESEQQSPVHPYVEQH